MSLTGLGKTQRATKISSVAINLFPAIEHVFEASAKTAKELELNSTCPPSAWGIEDNESAIRW
jgi:hypothetical protein